MVKQGRSNRYAPYVRAAANVASYAVRRGLKRAAENVADRMTNKRRRPTRTRRLFQRVPTVGNGSSQSWFRSGRGPKKLGKMLKALQPARVMNQTTSTRIESSIGTQLAYADNFGTAGQIQDYFKELTTDGSFTQRLYLKKITADYLISNATSSNTFIRIYELIARKDFNVTTTSQGAYSSLAIWSPVGAFDQGLYDINSSQNATLLGASPFHSKLFTNLWKVKKVFSVELGSGRSHKHTTSYNINKMIAEDRVGKDTSSRRCQILGGVTRAVMIIAYGAPVNSDANDANVSTAKSALNVVRMDRHEIHSVDPQGSKIYRISTLPTFTDAQEVDEDGDVQAPSEC